MSKGKVVVFGGLGFIGRNLISVLENKGYQPVIVDVIDRSAIDLAQGSIYLKSHKINAEEVKHHINEASYVIDLAYSSTPKTSFEHPIEDIYHNLPRSVELMQLVSGAPVKKLLIISSGGTVYGESNDTLISEDAETNPVSPYGITKLAIEKYALMYHHLNGLPVSIVRPSNPFGPGQKPYQGQGFIPTAISRILSKKKVTVFGEVGTIRDYIFIEDLVNAIFLIMVKGNPGQAYNVGSGIGRSNIEVLQSISEVMGADLEIDFKPARKFDVTSNVLDSARLMELDEWSCNTSFNTGLKKTVNWIKQYSKNEGIQ